MVHAFRLQALGANGGEHATCVQFVAVDINNAASLEAALRGADLVVHTAGPFQRKETCGVLEAALATRTPYMDVCDDADYSQRAKGYHEAAQAAGVPAITTAGATSASPCLSSPVLHVSACLEVLLCNMANYRAKQHGRATDCWWSIP